MILVPSILFFILGLIIGSFLNVVIIRMNTQKSFFGSFGGRSACMSCQNKLCWYELVPFFSFCILKGRCKNCKSKISLQYPLVEFATGFVFMSLFLKFQHLFFFDTFAFFLTYIYYAFMFSLLLVIAVYDLRHKIIPDILSFVFGVLAFLGLFFFTSNNLFGFSPHIPSILDFLSGIFLSLPFVFFWFISGGRWMGLGDAKLTLGIGWLLGLSSALSGLVVAFWSGAIVGICLVIISKKHKMISMGMKSEIPFAPFLVLGAFASFILGLNFFVI